MSARPIEATALSPIIGYTQLRSVDSHWARCFSFLKPLIFMVRNPSATSRNVIGRSCPLRSATGSRPALISDACLRACASVVDRFGSAGLYGPKPWSIRLPDCTMRKIHDAVPAGVT